MNAKHCAALAALLLTVPASQICAQAPVGDSGAAPATPEKKPALGKMLKSADANGDQKLDLAEIHAKFPRFPAERFTGLDKNQDGFLEASELPERSKVEGQGGGREGAGAKLRAADTNQDGKLSQEEFSAGFPNAPAERFAALDRNQDGFVDRTDREAVAGASDEGKKEKGEKKKEKGEHKANGSVAEAVPYVKGLISAHDADKDGKLTKAELEAAKPGFPEKSFAAMDRNKDGVVSDADLDAATN